MKTVQRAIIREDECIGCSKCIPPCPVDAIIGAAKFMHTVITDECIGCGLCVAPCPVDCITLYEIPLPAAEERVQIAQKARSRVIARKQRLFSESETRQSPALNAYAARKVAIAAAVARVSLKKIKN